MTSMNKDVNSKSNATRVIIIVAIVVLLLAVVVDIVLNYVPLDQIFNKSVNYTTEKEVTVTDEGIADAVDKLYDATVVVEVGVDGEISGWGSGFVYKVDGNSAYILTNNHVVEDASTITIVYSDESTTDGTVVGTDTYADVAVVKVDADTILATAEIGSSEDTRLGDTIFAIGTPISLSYKFTVTRGIMSGKDRFVTMSNSSSSNPFQQASSDSWYMKLLQIDASINSGNSGGPLANSNGEVIGITNSKLSNSYSSSSIENMGFAIPIEDAMAVAEQIESNGKITRPYLGVSMTTIEGASYNKITLPESVTTGAVIVDVQSGTCADKAGLKSGDVIIKMDDYEISDYKYLKYYLYRYNVGDKVKVTYLRDGKEKTTEITLKATS